MKITPEERLLKIIEGPVPSAGKQTKGALKSEFDLVSLEKKIKNLFFDKNNLNNLDLGKVNRAIAVVCAVFTIFWIFSFAREDFAFKERLEAIKAGAGLSVYKPENSRPMGVNIEGLMAGAAKRNIFKSSSQGNEAEALPGQTPKQQAPAQAGTPGDIKLVGIIWADNPQAMLENTKEQKTFLVNAGDNIGDLKVKKILSDKIIIGKGDQEWELR